MRTVHTRNPRSATRSCLVCISFEPRLAPLRASSSHRLLNWFAQYYPIKKKNTRVRVCFSLSLSIFRFSHCRIVEVYEKLQNLTTTPTRPFVVQAGYPEAVAYVSVVCKPAVSRFVIFSLKLRSTYTKHWNYAAFIMM